jgi:hypothetical protein
VRAANAGWWKREGSGAMALWLMTRVSGEHVALRIRRADERVRRVVPDTADAHRVREEWRCTRCREWFARETVMLLESGRVVAGAPEISAYCAPCHEAPRLRGKT